MEFALLLLLGLNLVATIYFGKQLLSREEYRRIEFVSIPSEEYDPPTQAGSEQKETPQPEVVLEPIKADNRSYSAWENKKNIPWNGTQRTPEPPAPRPEGYGYVK